MSTADPTTIHCRFCYAPAGTPCLGGPQNRPRKPHQRRVRDLERAAANRHVIVGEYNGDPVVLVEVEPGGRTATFECPWCGGRHTHGVDDEEYRQPTGRVAHCRSIEVGHYYLVADVKAVPK